MSLWVGGLRGGRQKLLSTLVSFSSLPSSSFSSLPSSSSGCFLGGNYCSFEKKSCFSQYSLFCQVFFVLFCFVLFCCVVFCFVLFVCVSCVSSLTLFFNQKRCFSERNIQERGGGGRRQEVITTKTTWEKVCLFEFYFIFLSWIVFSFSISCFVFFYFFHLFEF